MSFLLSGSWLTLSKSEMCLVVPCVDCLAEYVPQWESSLRSFQMACSLCVSAPGMLRSGSDAMAASRRTTMWSSAACSDWSIQSMLPDMWQALRVTSTRWLTDSRRAVALWRRVFIIFSCINLFFCSFIPLMTIWRSDMWLPGIQEDGVQRRVHGSDHVIHPVRTETDWTAWASIRLLSLMAISTVTLGWCVWRRWWCHWG